VNGWGGQAQRRETKPGEVKEVLKKVGALYENRTATNVIKNRPTEKPMT